MGTTGTYVEPVSLEDMEVPVVDTPLDRKIDAHDLDEDLEDDDFEDLEDEEE